MSFYSCKIYDVLLVTMYLIPVWDGQSFQRRGYCNGLAIRLNISCQWEAALSPHRNKFGNIVNLVSLNIQIKGRLLLF